MKAKHELKIVQEYFKAVKDGRKKFEIRKNDRDYNVGDILVLLEYDKYYEAFTGEKITVEITYLTGYAQQNDYVVLGIEEIQEGEELIEIKKVVIPKFVADIMTKYVDLRTMLTEEYYSNSTEEIDNDDVQCWIDDNFETLCKAWLDGYEIEKEKLYYVRLPVSVWNEHNAELETRWGYLKYDNTSDESNIALYNHSGYSGFKAKLTEETIKSIDERYWAFAVEAD